MSSLVTNYKIVLLTNYVFMYNSYLFQWKLHSWLEMHAFKTSIQQAKDNTKELSRIGVNTAKTFEQTSRESITRRGGGNDTTTARVSVEAEEGQDRARRRF